MTTIIDDFLATLSPKIAKQIKKASTAKTEFLPTASIGLNRALGGGFGVGRIALLYGNTSSGKSLLATQTIGQLQKKGKVCAYADVEGTYDKRFAAELGVDNEELILISKRSFGAITEEVVPLIRGGLDFLVIDSISLALPEVFVDENGEIKAFENLKQIGAHAKSCTIMVNALHYVNEKTAIVLISQTTTEIGQTYTKQVPHGGKKVGFAASQIIKLTAPTVDKDQIKGSVYIGSNVVEQPVGRKVQALVEKNKIGEQSRVAAYDIYYAKTSSKDKIGIDYYGELVEEAIAFGVVRKSGAWVYFGDEQFNGKPKLIKEVKANDQLFKDIKSELDKAVNGGLIE